MSRRGQTLGDQVLAGNDRLLRPGLVAKALGVNEKTLREWAEAGTVPSVRIGSHRRYPYSAVRDLINGEAVTPNAAG